MEPILNYIFELKKLYPDVDVTFYTLDIPNGNPRVIIQLRRDRFCVARTIERDFFYGLSDRPYIMHLVLDDMIEELNRGPEVKANDL